MFSLTRTIKYLNACFYSKFWKRDMWKISRHFNRCDKKRTISASSSYSSSVITTSENWGRLKLTSFAFIVV